MKVVVAAAGGGEAQVECTLARDDGVGRTARQTMNHWLPDATRDSCTSTDRRWQQTPQRQETCVPAGNTLYIQWRVGRKSPLGTRQTVKMKKSGGFFQNGLLMQQRTWRAKCFTNNGEETKETVGPNDDDRQVAVAFAEVTCRLVQNYS